MANESDGRPSRRGGLLSAEKRLLLHLGDLRDSPNEYDVDPRRTLNQMCGAIRVSRTHLSRIVPALKEEELVATKTGRPRGGSRICEYCILTDNGWAEAKGVKEEVQAQPVHVTLPGDDGGKRVLFGQLGDYLVQNGLKEDPPDALLASYIDAEGTLAVADILDDQKVQKASLASDAPRVASFFGREEEMKAFEEVLMREGTRALVIQGMPGMGKTTLASKFLSERRDVWNTLWMNIHDYTTLNNVLARLVELATAMEQGEDLCIPPEGQAVDLELFVERFLTSVGDEPTLIVLDDLHKSSPEIRPLVRALIEGGHRAPGLRLMVLARHIPLVYDRRAVVSRKEVVEFELVELDRGSGVEMLKKKGFSEEEALRAYEVAQGVPFYMEISDNPVEMRRHLSEEVFRELLPTQLDMMDILSAFRVAVPWDAVFRHDEAEPEHLENLLSRALVKVDSHGSLYCHDILKKFFYQRLSPKLRMELHAYCADFMAQSKGIDRPVERIYHRLGAGEHQRAALDAIESHQRIIQSGDSGGLNALMSRFDPQEISDETWIELCLAAGRTFETVGNFPKALKYYENAYGRSQEIGDKRHESLALCRLGYVNEEVGEIEDVERYMYEALDACMATKDDSLMVEVLRGMGRMHWKKSEHEKGRKRYMKALEILEKHRDPDMLGTIMIDLANIHWDGDDFHSAIKYGDSAVKILTEEGDLKELARAHQTLGLAHESLGEYDESRVHFEKALEINESLNHIRASIYTKINLAHTLAMDRKMGRAESTMSHVKDQVIQYDLKNMLQKVFRVEAMIAEDRGDPSKADYYFEKALGIAKERFPRFSHKLAEEYSTILVDRGENDRAVDVLRRSLDMGAGDIPYIKEKLTAMIDDINGTAPRPPR